MANMDQTARINVDTAQGVQALKNLQNQVSRTNQVFGDLKNGLMNLVAVGVVKSTYDMANALSDSAKAAGLSTGTLLAFSRAVSVSGGTMSSAAGGVDNFSQAVDAAATGSIKAQDQFAQLGITLNDLRTLSEEQIFKKMIAGLASIDDTSKRAAIAMSIMGKAGKGVEFKNVAESMAKVQDESDKMADAFNHAADARENINKTFLLFQAQLLTALEPISKLANAVLESSQAVEKFIRIIVTIGLAVASFTLLGKAISLVRAGVVALTAGWDALVGFFTVASNGVSQFGLILEQVGLLSFVGKLKLVVSMLGEFGTWLVNSIPGLGAVAAAVWAVVEALKGGVEWFGKWLGVTKESTKVDKDTAGTKREVIDAFKKQRLELEYTSVAFGRANKLIVDQINLDNQLIGTSKDYADVIRAQEEIYKRAADESEKLRKAKSELSEEEKRAGIGDVMDKQIKKIQEVAAADAKRVETVIKNGARLQSIEQLRLFGIQREIEVSNTLRGIQDDQAKLTLTSIEQKYYDIDAAAKASAKSAIEAEQSRLNRKLTPEEAEKYYTASIKGTNTLKSAQADLYKESRKFSTGWNQAFNEYVENATNAATQAQTIFQSFTQGMEDALFNLFKTGKLGWKGFMQDMVDTLLKSQIKQLMGNIMSGVGGGGSGGNIFSSLGKMLGFANGGLIPTNDPVIVGERGPEILSGVGGRTVTPNSALGGTVTYNINAVDAASFKQMLAADPTFLHAVAEQGRRRLPGSR